MWYSFPNFENPVKRNVLAQVFKFGVHLVFKFWDRVRRPGGRRRLGKWFRDGWKAQQTIKYCPGYWNTSHRPRVLEYQSPLPDINLGGGNPAVQHTIRLHRLPAVPMHTAQTPHCASAYGKDKCATACGRRVLRS